LELFGNQRLRSSRSHRWIAEGAGVANALDLAIKERHAALRRDYLGSEEFRHRGPNFKTPRAFS